MPMGRAMPFAMRSISVLESQSKGETAAIGYKKLKWGGGGLKMLPYRGAQQNMIRK